jgi:hypothetical protein
MIASKSDGIAAASSSPRHRLTNPFSLVEDGFFTPLVQLLAGKRGWRAVEETRINLGQSGVKRGKVV